MVVFYWVHGFDYTMGMIKSLTTLLAFQALGELVALTLIPAMPGPVLGLIFLFLYLIARKGPDAELAHTSSVFSAHLGLLFVPAAVGVVVFLPLLQDFAWPLIAALVASVVCSLAVSAWLLNALATRYQLGDAPAPAVKVDGEGTDEV